MYKKINRDNKMKYCLFIPTTPLHIKYIDNILDVYTKGTVLVDEIVVSVSNSHLVNKVVLDELVEKYNCNILEHHKTMLAGPNRQQAMNVMSDIIVYHDSDDIPHRQRIEIIKYFFENYDILHLSHDYMLSSDSRVEEHKKSNIKIQDIKFLDSDTIRNKYFPNNKISDPLKITNGYGDTFQHLNMFNMGAVGGPISIYKHILNDIKWKDRHEEVLFKLNKSIIINSILYYY